MESGGTDRDSHLIANAADAPMRFKPFRAFAAGVPGMIRRVDSAAIQTDRGAPVNVTLSTPARAA